MRKIDKEIIEDILSLTPMQEGMLFHYLKEQCRDLYFEQLSLELSGFLTWQTFEKAWGEVVRNNRMLRTFFRWEKLDKPTQVVIKRHTPDTIFYDLSGIQDPGRQSIRLETIKQDDRENSFDLQEVPFRVTLCKISENSHHMIISNHHILFDGWSTGIILKEFFQAYDALSRGKPVIPLAKTKFKEFIKWHQQRDAAQEAAFWKSHLQGVDRQLGLPVKSGSVPKVSEQRGGSGKCRVRFEKGTVEKLVQFVMRYKITLAALLYTAWGILLQRYTNSDDVLFGTTVSGRTAGITGIEDVVGLFINTVPLRVRSIRGENITTLIRGIGEVLRQREPYSATSLVDIKKYSAIDNKEILFDTLVVLENYPIDKYLKAGTGKLAVCSYTMAEQTHYDVTVGITKTRDRIEVAFSYREGWFEKNAIECMARHWECIVEDIIENPGQEVQDIDMLSSGEKRQLLLDFNNTGGQFPADKPVPLLFEEQVERTPDRIALVGRLELADGSKCLSPMRGPVSLTYCRLNEKSNQLAHLLRQKSVKSDTIVPIMTGRSLEMMVGILGILKAGGAYLPIDPDYPGDRIRYLLKDSASKLLLFQQKYVEFVEALDFDGEIIKLDSEPYDRKHSRNLDRLNLPEDLAYIIYTSGSTGLPKGVMIKHKSVVNLLVSLYKKYPLEESDIYLLKTTYLFDVSVSEIFGWFWEGGRLSILDPGKEKDPRYILDSIEAEGITHINFVPSMFNIFVELLNHLEIKKLSGLKYIFLAGEAISPESIIKFRRFKSNVVIENLYGPTEAAIYTSRYPLSGWDGTNGIPIGIPIDNIKVYIFSVNGNMPRSLQPLGVPGELCISGTGLARGYANRPELTVEKFCLLQPGGRTAMQLFPHHLPLYPIYRTGDLARWLPDGNIEFLGRIDFQVKIRGFRIEPGEIERQLIKHSSIKDALVIARENETGEKYLCAYIAVQGEEHIEESGKGLLFKGVREFLSQTLPDYMIPAYFVLLERIPLNPNGKVDINALPGAGAASLKKYMPPRNDMEKILVDIWAGVLGLDSTRIGIDDDFFELGGHSLKATLLISRIQKVLKVSLHLEVIFKLSTINKLSEYLSGLTVDKYVPINPAEKMEYYVLSSSQQRIYFSHQMDRTVLYNMLSTWVLEGAAGINKLENTFKKLIKRHESLRTSFRMVRDKVVQKVHDANEVEFIIEKQVLPLKKNDRLQTPNRTHISKKGPNDMIKDFVQPFDLSRAPLLRVRLITLPKGGSNLHLLLFDIHHIISDGISVNIFVKEFKVLYGGGELPELRIQYKDYSRWEKSQNGNKEYRKKTKKYQSYWLEQFKNGVPLLDLCTDYPRPAIQGYEGKVTCFELTVQETLSLKKMALEEGMTLYMVLLAIYTIMLAKISGKEAVVTGTAVAGRSHADLETIMGIFINTLALINYPSGDKTFIHYLTEVKNRTLEAFKHQDYPFEELVSQVVKNRRADRHPVFDVMFALQDEVELELTLEDLTLVPYESDFITSKFDLALVVVVKDKRLGLQFQYCTKLFKEETIKRHARYFNEIVTAVTTNKHVKLKKIKISHQLLSMKSRTTFDDFDF